MFAPRTTFIIGAGASAELGFPVGWELLESIRKALFPGDRYKDVPRGDDTLWRLIEEIQRLNANGPDLFRFHQAAERIRAAARHANSIDNLVDQNDHDAVIPTIAKLAIAKIIMERERNSHVMPSSRRPDEINMDQMSPTWLYRFGKMLCAGTDVRPLNKCSKMSRLSSSITIVR